MEEGHEKPMKGGGESVNKGKRRRGEERHAIKTEASQDGCSGDCCRRPRKRKRRAEISPTDPLKKMDKMGFNSHTEKLVASR